MNNEDKVKNYKLKKIYKSLIIITSLLTIILESFALFGMISFLWGFIPFFLSYYFKGLYEDVSIKDIFKRKKKCCTNDTKQTSSIKKCEDEKKTDDNLEVTKKDTELKNMLPEEKEKEEIVTVSKTKKVTKTSKTKQENNNYQKNYKSKNNSKKTNYKNVKSNNSKTSTKNVSGNKRTSSK